MAIELFHSKAQDRIFRDNLEEKINETVIDFLYKVHIVTQTNISNVRTAWDLGLPHAIHKGYLSS